MHILQAEVALGTQSRVGICPRARSNHQRKEESLFNPKRNPVKLRNALCPADWGCFLGQTEATSGRRVTSTMKGSVPGAANGIPVYTERLPKRPLDLPTLTRVLVPVGSRRSSIRLRL